MYLGMFVKFEKNNSGTTKRRRQTKMKEAIRQKKKKDGWNGDRKKLCSIYGKFDLKIISKDLYLKQYERNLCMVIVLLVIYYHSDKRFLSAVNSVFKNKENGK
jgi:hypothetical protein